MGVVVFHSLSDTGQDFEFGAAGIHLFFGLSGFLMWTVTARTETSPARFVADRLRRIVPLYWIATLGAVASLWVVPGFFWQASADTARVAASLVFLPREGVAGGIYPVLYQGWTLQFEMFFYAVFAVCLVLPVRWRLWTLSAVLVLLAWRGIIVSDATSPLVRTYTDPIGLEFLAGAWAAQLGTGRHYSRAVAGAVLAAGLLLFVASAGDVTPFGSWGVVVLPLAVGTVLTGAVALEQAGGVPHWPTWRRVGEASYSIYLFQTFGFAAASRFAFHWPVPIRAVVYIIAALVTGLLVYRWIEAPLQAILRQRSQHVALAAA